MTSARTPQPQQDPAAWRLVFCLVSVALDGRREKFFRLLTLILVAALAVGGLVLLLGPYPVAGLGASSLASRAYLRRTRNRPSTSSRR